MLMGSNGMHCIHLFNLRVSLCKTGCRKSREISYQKFVKRTSHLSQYCINPHPLSHCVPLHSYDDPANVDKLLAARRNVAKTTETLTDTMDSMTRLDEATTIAVETTAKMESGTGRFADEANTFHENLVCHRKKVSLCLISHTILSTSASVVAFTLITNGCGLLKPSPAYLHHNRSSGGARDCHHRHNPGRDGWKRCVQRRRET